MHQGVDRAVDPGQRVYAGVKTRKRAFQRQHAHLLLAGAVARGGHGIHQRHAGDVDQQLAVPVRGEAPGAFLADSAGGARHDDPF